MKAKQIEVGGVYLAKISGRVVKARVDAIREQFDHRDRSRTCYDVTNLTTGRRTMFRSAQKFRGRA